MDSLEFWIRVTARIMELTLQIWTDYAEESAQTNVKCQTGWKLDKLELNSQIESDRK